MLCAEFSGQTTSSRGHKRGAWGRGYLVRAWSGAVAEWGTVWQCLRIRKRVFPLSASETRIGVKQIAAGGRPPGSLRPLKLME